MQTIYLGEHLTWHARGAEIWSPIMMKQACLPPRGFLSVGGFLGGGKDRGVLGKRAVKVAHGADAPPLMNSNTYNRKQPALLLSRYGTPPPTPPRPLTSRRGVGVRKYTSAPERMYICVRRCKGPCTSHARLLRWGVLNALSLRLSLCTGGAPGGVPWSKTIPRCWWSLPGTQRGGPALRPVRHGRTVLHADCQ